MKDDKIEWTSDTHTQRQKCTQKFNRKSQTDEPAKDSKV